MNYLPDATLFMVLTLALVVLGWCLSNPSRSSFEAALVPGATFLGFYAWLIWLVGSAAGLFPALWCALPWPILAFLMVFKRRNLAHHARHSLSAIRALPPLDKALSLGLCGLFALAFCLSLAPPNGADYDSLVYHLAVPSQYLRAGKVVELPYDHHSYFPMSLEMLYALGLWARGAVFAKLFHWLMLPLGALALIAIGKRGGSARGGLIGAVLYASTPLITQEATTAYIDLGFAAFTFLAVLCLASAFESRSRLDFALCGAFCGFCLGTKYFGALVFGFLGLYLLISGFKNAIERPQLVRNALFFAIPALLFGSFWYARNIFWTGNPVFPFAFGLFGGRGWDAEMARLYDESQAIYGFGRTPFDLLLLPWRLAMAPLNYGQPFWPLAATPPGGTLTGAFEVPGLLLSSFVGPALVALGFPALFLKPKPRPIAICAALFTFLFAFWFLTSQQVRYLIPSLGMLALLGGWGATQIAPRLRFSRLIGAAMLGLWLLWSPYYTLQNNRSSFGVLSGAQTPADYLRRTFPGFEAMNTANQTTPKKAVFAVFGEPRCFYLDRNYFWGDDPHNNLLDYTKIKTGAGFVRALRGLGATHVLWNTRPGQNGGFGGPPRPLMDEAIADDQLILVTDEMRGYRIYRMVN